MLRTVFPTGQMPDSANKDDVSETEPIDEVVTGPVTTPDQEANVPLVMTREQYAIAQEQWAKMIKEMDETKAQAKVSAAQAKASADLLISVRKESANHAMAAKNRHGATARNEWYVIRWG